MIKKVFQGIFLGGTILLFLVCVAGFFGLFEAPPAFYALFWGGFFVFMGLLRVLIRVGILIGIFGSFND